MRIVCWLFIGLGLVGLMDQTAVAIEPLLNADNQLGCGEDGCGEDGCGEATSGSGACAFGLVGLPFDKKCADAIAGLNYDNDFSYLDEPCSCCWMGDRWKRLLKEDDRWLDLGGHFRLRLHDENGMGRQPGTAFTDPGHSDPLLMQLRLYANWQVNKSVRIFAEGMHADVVSANPGYQPRGNERNRAGFLNLFADYRPNESTELRIGRQQIRYGSRRLIAGPGWANTSRNHDGARLRLKSAGATLDAFYFRPVTVDFDRIDPVSNDQELFGLWSTSKDDAGLLDVYYVGYQDHRPGRQRLLHHIGVRIKGGTDWQYELEGIGQFGRQQSLGLDHAAATVTAGVGKELSDLPWSPTVWFYFDYATGENGGGDFNRYDRIFDRAHYFLGFVDTVQRSNVKLFSLQAKWKPHERLDLLTRYYRVLADEAGDIVAGIGSAPAAQRTDTDDYGHVFDVATQWKVASRTDLRLGYSYFLSGQKVISGRDASLLYLEWNVSF